MEFDARMVQAIATGTFDPALSEFDEQAFSQNWHLPFFIVFSCLRRYIKLDHATGGGDLTMSMVASEIWLYNIGRRLTTHGYIPDAATLADEESRREHLPKCNTYSISQSLGISAETVRRKVNKLVEMGWIERSAKGELHITAACEEAFTPEANLQTMRDFVATARTLFNHLNLM